MKTTFLFGLLAFVLCTAVHAQRSALLQFMKAQKADTAIVYSNPSLSCISTDTCNALETRYLFWLKSGKAFMAKMSRCNVPTPVVLEGDNPFKFYFTNAAWIVKEKIPVPVPEKKTAPKDSDDGGFVSAMITADPKDCIPDTYILDMYIGRVQFDKYVSMKYLTPEASNTANRNTKLAALIEKLAAAVARFNALNNTQPAP